jgi:ATP-dependent 26S proteasome regulatory subunit
MNDWLKNNEAYLGVALEWLRLKLVEFGKPSTQEQDNKTEKKGGWSPFVEKKAKSRTTSSVDSSAKNRLTELADQMIELEKNNPALAILSQKFALSAFEQNILFICSAMELDTRIADLCAMAQANLNRPYPTFALALVLFDEPNWNALSAERPLRYWRLLEINQPGAQPLTTSALRADERIVNFVKGLNTLDDQVATLITPMQPQDEKLPPSQQAVIADIAATIQQASTAQRSSLIQLTGIDVASKKAVASQVATALHCELCQVLLENLPSHQAELETFARLWQREAILLPIAFYIEAGDSEQNQANVRLINHNRGLCFLDTREAWSKLDGTTALFEITNPSPIEQQKIWSDVLGAGAGENPAMLAGQFNFDTLTIQHLAKNAALETTDNSVNVKEKIWPLCLANTRPRLAALAQRLEPKATWEDIVLPNEAYTLLHQIVDQTRNRSQVYDTWGFRDRMNRGLGISALFAGESGTGKTMAAEVIANDLKLDLYRVDLSAVVSKYIGETEKNLRKLFDAAEDGSAILFFDEADAVFGKRSEVKDSHDRYANIEINYLLQRMEAFRGLAILATNMKSALDQAFTRRLRFIINFPFPGISERKLMWQKAFPTQLLAKAELDFDRLGRLALTGGAIHNIALNSAFLAAARHSANITMPIVLEAARSEFKKMDKPINEAEFRLMEVVGNSK